MPNLELISPVQIAVQPVSTTPNSSIVTNPKVLLDRGREIARIIPQYTPTDAHPRRDEVPQIPLSDDVGAAVVLATVDGRPRTRRASWSSARDIRTLKVCTHQDRSRCISRAGQEALGAPQIQIMRDQPIMPALLTPLIRGTTGWQGPRYSTAIAKIPILSLHPRTHGAEPIGTDLPGYAGRYQSRQALADGVGAGGK